MDPIRRASCDPHRASCLDEETSVRASQARAAAPPASRPNERTSAMQDRHIAGDVVAAARAGRPEASSSKRIGEKEAPSLPTPELDRRATELRAALSRGAAKRREDVAELAVVERELTRREAAKTDAARVAHGGVLLCKRTADLPLADVHGAQHWWLETTRKSVGMGPATGNVPGHGESLPESWDTKLIDHREEPRTDCTPVSPLVSEDCVDRELQLDERTGKWVPLLNDCHSVVKRILATCEAEGLEKLNEEALRTGTTNHAR